MRTKILVCGSTGFLAANFIRYVLYRSKDFDIVSVDNLDDLNDAKRIYINKNNKFYIGDFADEIFIKKVIYVEKPDYIICDEIKDYGKLVVVADILERTKIPVLMIVSNLSGNMLNSIKDVPQTILSLPNKFGMRQKPSTGGIGCLLKQFFDNRNFTVSNQSVPWVYAEDISSFIWYLIETKASGLKTMPPLGYISEKNIAGIINNLYKKEISMSACSSDHLVVDYKWESSDWVPDSKSLEKSLEKTIKWFDVNRWALNE